MCCEERNSGVGESQVPSLGRKEIFEQNAKDEK